MKTKKPSFKIDNDVVFGLFKPEEIKPIHEFETFEGKWVVLKPYLTKPQFWTRRGLLFLAKNGNGCRPANIGTGVFGNSFEDGEFARWERPDIFGVFVGELPTNKSKYLVRVRRVSVQSKDVEIEAVTQVEAKEKALFEVGNTLLEGFCQPATSTDVEWVQVQQ